MFELKLNNKTIKLKWGTWAMREFCQQKGITLEKYFEVLGSSQFDLDNIIKLVYVGYKSACISNKVEEEYNEVDICDWIDEVGSIFKAEGQLIDFIKYIVSTTVTSIPSKPVVEKKKPNKANLGRHTS